MAEPGQVAGGIVDNPLAFDNAISLHSAQAKGITSPVAGDLDVLLVPTIEAGNMMYRQFVYAPVLLTIAGKGGGAADGAGV